MLAGCITVLGWYLDVVPLDLKNTANTLTIFYLPATYRFVISTSVPYVVLFLLVVTSDTFALKVALERYFHFKTTKSFYDLIPSMKLFQCFILFHRRRKKRNGTNFVASNTSKSRLSTNESSFQHGILSTFTDMDATHATANRSQCPKTKNAEDAHASSERIGNPIDKNEEKISIKIVSHLLSFSFCSIFEC